MGRLQRYFTARIQRDLRLEMVFLGPESIRVAPALAYSKALV